MSVLNFLKSFKIRITVQYAVEKGPKIWWGGSSNNRRSFASTIMTKNWGLESHCPLPPSPSSAGSVSSKHWVLYQLSFLFQIWWLTLCPLSRAPAIFDTFVILVRAIKKREIYTEEKKPGKKEEIFSLLCQLTSFFDQWINQPGFYFDSWRKQQEKSIKIDSSTLQELGVAYYLAVGVAWPPCCRSRPRLWNASLGGAKAKLKMNKKKNGLKKLSNHWWKNSRKTTL